MTDRGPLVAVSRRPQADMVNGEATSSSASNFAKVLECLRAVGLTPVISTTHTDLSRVSAVVIPGGGDVSPALYGGAVSDRVYGVSDEQDAIDLALVAHATVRGLPLLGICRGAQLINVARGGTLHEDLPHGSDEHHNSIATSSYANVFVSHEVHIDAGSRTAAALRGDADHPDAPLTIPVRSAHHQSVRDVGAELRVVARAEDGTIEALEAATGWTVAVQWHPEAELADGILKHGLFSALAEAIASGHAQAPTQQFGSGQNARLAAPDLISFTS